MSPANAVKASSKLRRATLLPTLLPAALALLLSGPAPSDAARARSSCASDHAKRARACAERRHARTHGKAKKRSKHHRPSAGKGSHNAATPAPSALAPATCEDGSRPTSEGDGSFSCADGSEPVCQHGVEPVAARGSGKPVCPAPAAGATEWSEAECEDGGTPERAQGGVWACEDGSEPACADESQPRSSDDGSMLVCVAQGSPAPSSPSADEEEDEEDEAEGSFRVRAASGS